MITKKWTCRICKKIFEKDYPVITIDDELIALESHLQEQLDHLQSHMEKTT
ncbi:hypothetical protein LCGC14_0926130 [marine sediment metagenome]|uniref:Uncharacterized protein n=1 Tax=marine sediment metagenome TaxID=412755 RepID=A0A0F9PA80_9ZZZZ